MGGGGGGSGVNWRSDGLPEPLGFYPNELRNRVVVLESEVAALKSSAQSGGQLERWLEKALTYQTAVMAIAYAGFFVLWEKVEGHGPDILHASAGILMGISLLVFIIWTLLQMHAVHQELVGQKPWPDPDATRKAGPHVFMFSVVTGLGAAAFVMLLWVIRFVTG